MKPTFNLVNLEETLGKVVGRVRPIAYDSLVALAKWIKKLFSR